VETLPPSCQYLPVNDRDGLRVAWLTTGRGPGSFGALEYLLRAVREGLPVSLAVVFVNRDRGDAEPTDRLIALVEAAGIPVETLASVAFRKARGGKLSRPGEPLQPWRLEYDDAVAERLRKYEFDVGVMFGYMLIASERLHRAFPFLNDHPALPDGPVGTYQQVIRELIRTEARESGCMMNRVTGDVDRGPALTYCRYPLRDPANQSLWDARDESGPELDAGDPLFDDIRTRGVRRERPFVVETLRAISTGQIQIAPGSPVDLTAAVEAALLEPRT